MVRATSPLRFSQSGTIFPGPISILWRGWRIVFADGESRERGKVMVRRAYIRKVEDRLERLEDKIDHIRMKMTTPVDGILDRIGQEIRDLQIRDLRAKAEAVRKKIRAVVAAEASNWGRLKSPVDEALMELGKVVDEAVERFRKTGTGDR